jgi:hypothetical protein
MDECSEEHAPPLCAVFKSKTPEERLAQTGSAQGALCPLLPPSGHKEVLVVGKVEQLQRPRVWQRSQLVEQSETSGTGWYGFEFGTHRRIWHLKKLLVVT